MESEKSGMPPLEWIRAFETAARTGSFTAAANETGLTQSAISQRIAQLENWLGTPLFHRRARSIALTIEGEAWLPHVRSAFDGLQNSLAELFGAERGRLTLSASQSLIELWILPRIEQLSEISQMQLSVQTMVLGAHDAPQDDIVRIRYGAGDWPHPYKYRLYSERIAPMASPVLLELGGGWTEWPRISCSGPRPGWNDWASRFGTPTTPIPKLRFDTFLPAMKAAKAGKGVILGSIPLCDAELASGNLVQLTEEALSHHQSYWLIAGRDAVTREQWGRLTTAMQ